MENRGIESQLATELIYDGNIIKVTKDTILLPNDRRTTREVVEHASVAVSYTHLTLPTICSV